MSRKNWTFNNIPNLTGKTVIITGGNSGLGFEAVKALSRNNGEVILASRSVERGEQAKEAIQSEYPQANIEVRELDLADIDSIKEFTSEFYKTHRKLDVLLNNAGVMWCPYNKTKDGFESQMGTNHLGHFALTGLLLDALKEAGNARVVTVSSMGHRNAELDLDNFMFEKGGYKPTLAYYNSKLANLHFTYELQRKFDEHELDIISVAAHPGGSATNLARHIEKDLRFRLLKPLFYLMAQSAAMGTLPQVRASVDPDVSGGEYHGPGGFNEMRGHPVLVQSSEASHDREAAKRLWEMSEELTNVTFNFDY
jgi:NAD(P)-dependent dehydrogenase (short-subunit alcohol dehydrogenase family)